METKDLRKIKIYVEERKTTDGKKFNTYKAVTKNSRKIDCKFRKNVKELPTTTCYAYISDLDMNVDKNKEFPVLWVSEVQYYEDLSKASEKNNKKQLDELFGE